MKHEKQCKAIIRKILRAARWDTTIAVYVDDGEGFDQNNGNEQTEKSIIDTVFNVDESYIKFVDLTTSKTKGVIMVVLDYDTTPEEIICDYTSNRFTEFLISKAGL